MYLKTLIGMVVVSATALAAQAEQLTNEQMMAELQALRAEVSQLRGSQDADWMNERRAEEVKTLIRDVLSDAETRASLMDSSISAGHNGQHFFLASDDGNFLLEIIGQVQFRGVWNHANDELEEDPGNDDVYSEIEGFNIPRAKLGFQGNLFGPEFTFRVQGNFKTGLGAFGAGEEGDFELDDAWIAWNFHEGWTVRAGQFKGPFMRDELVDSKHQQAIERSIITDILGVDRTQGIELSWQGDPGVGYPIRAAVMLHDGSYGANRDEVLVGTALMAASIGGGPGSINATSFGDPYDFGVGARVEILLAGTWEQFNDYASWSGDAMGILLGAAINYDESSGGTSITLPDVLKWTVDLSFEFPDVNGLNFTFAYVGTDAMEDSADDPVGAGDIDPFGLMAQAGIFILPDEWDIFVRYEYFDSDISGSPVFAGLNNDELNIITFGTNYYMQRHALKFSLDVVYALDGSTIPLAGAGGALGLGLLPTDAINNGMVLSGDADDDDEQVAVRAQVQFLF